MVKLKLLAAVVTTIVRANVLFSGSGGCDTDDPTCIDPTTGTSTISTLLFNVTTGILEVASVYAGFNQPAWLQAIPDTYILLATETTGNTIHSLKFNPIDNSLEEISFSVSGDAPVHLATIEGYVVAANYMGGSLSVLPIDPNGSLGDAVEYKHVGSGPDPDRQEAPHVHSVYNYKNRIYAVDLGLDSIFWYDFDGGKLVNSTENYVKTVPGSGPRHLAFSTLNNNDNETVAHVICEMASHIETFKINPETGGFLHPPIGIVSTLPKNSEPGFSKAAEILVWGNFVYATNRGPADGSDSIGVYEIDMQTGELQNRQFVSSGGSFPRGAAITNNGGELLVGGQDSDNIAVFSINNADGTLFPAPLYNLKNITSPVTFTQF